MARKYQRPDRENEWWIDYKDLTTGKRMRERVGPSKKMADLALKKIEVALAEGRYLDVKRKEYIPFDQLADKYLELHAHNKKSFHSHFEVHVKLLKDYFKKDRLNQITTADIEAFKKMRLEKVEPSTVNRSLACLKSMFNKAKDWKDFDGVNPVMCVDMFKEKNHRLRFLEKDEILTVLAKASPYLKPILVVALNTGMRRGEILGLRWDDIDFKRDVICLLETKSGYRRELPMNMAVRSALMGIKQNMDSPYVFCHTDGSRVRDIRKVFFTALKDSGIKGLRFHDLRHTAASQMVMAGVDLNTVREILGHKSLDMTLRYAHLSPDHKKKAMDVLGQSIGLQIGSASDQDGTNVTPADIQQLKR